MLSTSYPDYTKPATPNTLSIFYVTICGTQNIKFANAQQTEQTYRYKQHEKHSIKKLHVQMVFHMTMFEICIRLQEVNLTINLKSVHVVGLRYVNIIMISMLCFFAYLYHIFIL
jgi:hypothetical protein